MSYQQTLWVLTVNRNVPPNCRSLNFLCWAHHKDGQHFSTSSKIFETQDHLASASAGVWVFIVTQVLPCGWTVIFDLYWSVVPQKDLASHSGSSFVILLYFLSVIRKQMVLWYCFSGWHCPGFQPHLKGSGNHLWSLLQLHIISL